VGRARTFFSFFIEKKRKRKSEKYRPFPRGGESGKRKFGRSRPKGAKKKRGPLLGRGGGGEGEVISERRGR